MKPENGFTLIELMIAVAIFSIVGLATVSTYTSQQRSSNNQREVMMMQQNLRAAISYMTYEIRMAGYDPTRSGSFGITDIQPKDINDGLDPNGNDSLEFAIDRDGSGGAVGPGDETVYFSIYNSPVNPGVTTDLALRFGVGGRQLLAENIVTIGFAFAFDANGDGLLDTYNAINMPGTVMPAQRERIIWAYDSDGDNDLDINLDADLDGDIDANDGPGGAPGVSPCGPPGAGFNGVIPPVQPLIDFNGVPIADVPLADIRAVRISILGKTRRQDSKYYNNNTYVVGHKIISPAGRDVDGDGGIDENHYMRLVTTIIGCRNMGL